MSTTMLQAVYKPTACHIPRPCLFHSFSIRLTSKNTSRTRLTRDLQPGSRNSRPRRRLEVAPKEHEREHQLQSFFTRDTLPHADPNYVVPSPSDKEKNASFRRRSKLRDEMDWKRRRLRGSRWAAETGGAPDIKSTRTEREDRRYPAFPLPGQQPSSSPQSERSPESTRKKTHENLPIMTEFYHPPSQSFVKPHYDPINATHRELVTKFTSPPLMPGLLSCITEVLGPAATPTPIQSLSLKWLLNSPDASLDSKKTSEWKQFLLASETGSGKSIAYLLPLLQNLKLSELNTTDPSTVSERALNPRALILAPTHELARQLSGFAKALLHEIKLRVSCASRANVKNTKVRDSTTRKMIAQFEEEIKKSAGNSEEFDVKRDKFPVDVVVGTPMKLLEMVRGRGWDRREDSVEDDDAKAKLRRGRDKVVGFGNWKKPLEMGLANIEWVIVDEADILFDPDFQETTRQLLADISEARGHPVPSLSGETPSSGSEAEKHSLNYPFNLILASATIPSALASYLDMHHPKLMRLASPNLHHLPKTLRTEYASWTGGNKFADIERRVRKVWAEDLSGTPAHSAAPLSKILIFCNKSTTVNELGLHLEERGIKNVALTSTSDQRKRGSNQHLEGFLRKHTKDREETVSDTAPKPVKPTLQPLVKSVPPSTKFRSNPKEEPHVMITTSLLSRGLDFSPSIRHVFMVDEPRNMIDFLHRAGRAGRAGEKGKVVVFGKLAGRGSAKAKEVRKRVGALVA